MDRFLQTHEGQQSAATVSVFRFLLISHCHGAETPSACCLLENGGEKGEGATSNEDERVT